MPKVKRPTQAAVLRLVRKWKRRLGLHEYVIGVEFGPDKDPENDADAECDAMPEYLQAKVRFNLDAINPDDIEKYVVHELFHIPTWRLMNFATTMCADDPVKIEELRGHLELLVTYLERQALSCAWPE